MIEIAKLLEHFSSRRFCACPNDNEILLLPFPNEVGIVNGLCAPSSIRKRNGFPFDSQRSEIFSNFSVNNGRMTELASDSSIGSSVLSVALLDMANNCWSVIAQVKLPPTNQPFSLLQLRSNIVSTNLHSNQFVFFLNDHPVVQSQEPFIDAHHLLPIAKISPILENVPMKPVLMSTSSYEANRVKITRSGSVESHEQKLGESCFEVPTSGQGANDY